MKNPESTLVISHMVLGLMCWGVGVLLLLLMMFVFQNPRTPPGIATIVIAVVLNAIGGWLVGGELAAKFQAHGYQKVVGRALPDIVPDDAHGVLGVTKPEP